MKKAFILHPNSESLLNLSNPCATLYILKHLLGCFIQECILNVLNTPATMSYWYDYHPKQMVIMQVTDPNFTTLSHKSHCFCSSHQRFSDTLQHCASLQNCINHGCLWKSFFHKMSKTMQGYYLFGMKLKFTPPSKIDLFLAKHPEYWGFLRTIKLPKNRTLKSQYPNFTESLHGMMRSTTVSIFA